ncbi:hypothetical protein ACFPN2_13945 [Steroidobacter flavus]|uniref:Tox-REase-5 domain-containing protein n=1 Tax=Steroidobacter flavus TaxID=1842136 RepID=A0ABV8SRH6_9GAMM
MKNASRIVSIWSSSGTWSRSNFGAYQQRSLNTLATLAKLDASFQTLTVVAKEALSPAPDEEHPSAELIRRYAFDENHAGDYLNLLAEGGLGSESLSHSGFAVSYCAYKDGQSVLPPNTGGAYLRLRGDSISTEPDAGTVMELPAGDARTPARFRQLLGTLIQTWECRIGGIALYDYERAVKGQSRNSYAGQWLFYLPFPHLSKCLPPDIRHEPFANGILIETTPHMPDANNPSDVAAGKRVRDVLDEFGLVNDATYAIEGWPPDQEETIYEQYITGAPANRKYTVHCINFDGYDADRKVLLYAKLFRRLKRHPKEWGLRNWDGPVLNEAKRQVRAAAKAGGVPIEWHIGLEEPAHQVRALLADYTDITEQQLRVIHTPLEEALTKP